MSRRCTSTIAHISLLLLLTTGCGSVQQGMVAGSTPTATPVTLTQLASSYRILANRLRVALCGFAAIAASKDPSTDILRGAAKNTADTSSSVTNRLAKLPWPGRMQADSQNLIMAVARVEADLRIAAERSTRASVIKHAQSALKLIKRIPQSSASLRKDLHIADESWC